jgi:Uma2 family endonuclease
MNKLVTKHDLTPDDLLAMPDGNNYELVDGELVERKMGWYSGWVGGRLFRFLAAFAEDNGVGWVTTADSSYQYAAGADTLVRKPDVSFVRRGQLPDEEPPEGHARLRPDLAAEVVSPKDLYYEVEKKVEEYLRAGVRLVWVINPATRKVRIHRLDGTITEVREDGELTGEDVVPGFRCPVSALFWPRTSTPPAE